jgi:hypothetical protein
MLVGFGALTGRPFALTGARVPSLSPLRCSRWICHFPPSVYILLLFRHNFIAGCIGAWEGVSRGETGEGQNLEAWDRREGWGEEGKERTDLCFLRDGHFDSLSLSLDFCSRPCAVFVLCCSGWESEGLKLSDSGGRNFTGMSGGEISRVRVLGVGGVTLPPRYPFPFPFTLNCLNSSLHFTMGKEIGRELYLATIKSIDSSLMALHVI